MGILRKFFGLSKPSNKGSQELRIKKRTGAKYKTLCPYCDKVIYRPEQKSKCPECNNVIYVKKEVNQNKNSFLTKAQAKADDEKRKQIRLEKDFKKVYSQFDIKVSNYRTKKKQFQRKGENPQSIDQLWNVFEELLVERVYDYHSVKMALFEMGIKKKKKGFEWKRLAARFELRRYQKNQKIKQVEVLAAGQKSCQHCQNLHGKRFSIEEALKQEPFPQNPCTNSSGSCNSRYNAVIN